MIPPSLDFTSVLFDPHKALYSDEVPLPYPKAKTYNNIAEYYSHTILKKKFTNESKKQVKPRERNYQWYYDTLGLSESQRNYIQSNKKKKRRKGKKPVPVVTIPGSPLKSERVTVCKSDFKDYCRRKYRSLQTTSAFMDIKSKEFETFLSNSTSESSLMQSALGTENPVSASVLPTTKRDKGESNSAETENSSSLLPSHPVSTTTSHVMKIEVPSTSCAVKTESCDSSDDCCPDDVLISNMKSNVLKGYTLKSVYESPSSIQIKKEPIFLSSKNRYDHMHSKSIKNPRQIANNEKLSEISKLGHPNSSCGQSLSSNSDMKSSSALNNSVVSSSKVKGSSKSSVKSQKKGSKKRKICDESELQADSETVKQKKKKRRDINKDECEPSRESNPCLKESAAFKENSSSNDSKSNIKPLKKRKKSALKSKENVLNCKNKIKPEHSSEVYHCTCNFPCGLSHLCTCGFYTNAKEALSKFKIPRKKK